MNKTFKVAQLLDGPTPEGMCRYLMISVNGEAWHVERPVDDLFVPPWQVGDDVVTTLKIVPCVGSSETMLCPDWWSLGATNVVKYDLRTPRDAVAVVWGAEHAKHLEYAAPTSTGNARRVIVFWPHDFASTDAMAAYKKWDVATSFVEFVRSNFDRENFTPTLYETLMLLYRHERVRPHKDPTFRARVFYLSHFDMAVNRRVFFTKIADSSPNDHQHAGLVDLARALRAYTIQYVMPLVTASERHVTAMREREQLRWLLRRHGVPEDFRLPGQDNCR